RRRQRIAFRLVIPYRPSRSRKPLFRRKVVEFGFSLPGRGPLAGLDVVLKLAEKADALRFDSLFVTDHVVMPVSSAKSVYPYTTRGSFPAGSRRTISSRWRC